MRWVVALFFVCQWFFAELQKHMDVGAISQINLKLWITYIIPEGYGEAGTIRKEEK